jgi:hypothetical protein
MKFHRIYFLETDAVCRNTIFFNLRSIPPPHTAIKRQLFTFAFLTFTMEPLGFVVFVMQR